LNRAAWASALGAVFVGACLVILWAVLRPASDSREEKAEPARRPAPTTESATTTTSNAATAAPAAPVAPSPDPVLVGAGDIAGCASPGDEATAQLLDAIGGTVFTAGDNAYPNGAVSDFMACYDPSWGRHKSRTRPAPGNHDYATRSGAGYYGYFGPAAGEPGRGYYSYDLGSWHVVALNSNCAAVGGCDAGSPQEQWLRQDLAASDKPCTAAYWHHPLFTSGATHASAVSMRPLFQALYDHDAEVLISGHNHNYERFAPQDPGGGRDDARGIRQFVAGTGGLSHYAFGATKPNSEVRNADTFGVLKLTLRSNSYEWEFVPQAGKGFTDSGSSRCH
jgi:acid phosphatase type 7